MRWLIWVGCQGWWGMGGVAGRVCEPCECRALLAPCHSAAPRHYVRLCAFPDFSVRAQDNLDHIRPATGAWDAPSAWNLPGREFPGPAAE